jgi:hypothetical protein
MVLTYCHLDAAESLFQWALARDLSYRYACLDIPVAIWRRRAPYELSFVSPDEATGIHPTRCA